MWRAREILERRKQEIKRNETKKKTEKNYIYINRIASSARSLTYDSILSDLRMCDLSLSFDRSHTRPPFLSSSLSFRCCFALRMCVHFFSFPE